MPISATPAGSDKLGLSSPTHTGLHDEIKTAVETLEDDAVTSDDVDSIVVLTQAAYDLLTPDDETLYVVVD